MTTPTAPPSREMDREALTPQREAEIRARVIGGSYPWPLEPDGVADAYVIATARSDVPHLLAEIDRLRRLTAEAEARGRREALEEAQCAVNALPFAEASDAVFLIPRNPRP